VYEQVQQVDNKTTTKTKDNVTLSVTCAIQYAVDPERVEDFFFKLNDPHRQIRAYVDDCVRSQLPSLTLDEAFESKERMASEIKDTVTKSMNQFGEQPNPTPAPLGGSSSQHAAKWAARMLWVWH